jgi:predicted aconitase
VYIHTEHPRTEVPLCAHQGYHATTAPHIHNHRRAAKIRPRAHHHAVNAYFHGTLGMCHGELLESKKPFFLSHGAKIRKFSYPNKPPNLLMRYNASESQSISE